MIVLDNIFLNLILVMFPILVYFIYRCYRELCMEKYNEMLFGVALVSSLYLCFKFGNIYENVFGILFCSFPVVISYVKRQFHLAILLSFIVLVYVVYYDIFNCIIFSCLFFCFCFIYLLGRKRDIKDNTFVLSVSVVQGFLVSFYYFFSFSDGDVFVGFEVVLAVLLFYILPFCLLYLFKFADRITNLYSLVNDLEKDKQWRNSLFKITHEVKNPIAVCKGYLDMLDVNDTNQVSRYIPIVREEIVRSLDIMNDFMEFSKIKINKELIDINLLLEDIEKELVILMHNRKVKFDSHILNDEVFIEGDYNRLKQVFINLIKNSLEAIEGSGNIQLFTHILKGRYYIEIIDDGVGMDSETLSRIKEMFFTTKVKGSGLGVSLSNEIIKAHDGCIDYYSKLGSGTKVVVKLPIVVI